MYFIIEITHIVYALNSKRESVFQLFSNKLDNGIYGRKLIDFLFFK